MPRRFLCDDKNKRRPHLNDTWQFSCHFSELWQISSTNLFINLVIKSWAVLNSELRNSLTRFLLSAQCLRWSHTLEYVVRCTVSEAEQPSHHSAHVWSAQRGKRKKNERRKNKETKTKTKKKKKNYTLLMHHDCQASGRRSGMSRVQIFSAHKTWGPGGKKRVLMFFLSLDVHSARMECHRPGQHTGDCARNVQWNWIDNLREPNR